MFVGQTDLFSSATQTLYLFILIEFSTISFSVIYFYKTTYVGRNCAGG